MAFVTDTNRPQPLWQPSPTAYVTFPVRTPGSMSAKRTLHTNSLVSPQDSFEWGRGVATPARAVMQHCMAIRCAALLSCAPTGPQQPIYNLQILYFRYNTRITPSHDSCAHDDANLHAAAVLPLAYIDALPAIHSVLALLATQGTEPYVCDGLLKLSTCPRILHHLRSTSNNLQQSPATLRNLQRNLPAMCSMCCPTSMTFAC